MSSTLGNAFAALIVRLGERLDLQPSDFLAFPSFQLRLGLDEMECVSNPARVDMMDGPTAKRFTLSLEAFSQIVNSLLTGKRDFVPSGKHLWNIYQDTLNEAEKATKPPEEASRALVEFGQRKAQLDVNEKTSVSGNDALYWLMVVTPVINLRAAQSWTTITLDRQAIEASMSKIPKDITDWLLARDLMRPLGVATVRSITIETCHLTMHRNWFDEKILTARNWRFRDDRLLSDGGNPPSGLLPAIMQGVVLIRKLEIELEPISAGIESASPESQSDDGQESEPDALLLKRVFFSTVPRSLNSFVGQPKTAATRVKSKNLEAAEATTGALHSPAIIKVQLVIEWIDKNMAAVRAQLDRVTQQMAMDSQNIKNAQAQISAIQTQIGAIRKSLKSPKAKIPGKKIGGITVTKTTVNKAFVKKQEAQLVKLEADLGNRAKQILELKSRIQNARGIQKNMNANLQKWTERRAQYQNFPANPFGADEVFLFATVCRRTPKSPNPSPEFFST